MVAFNPTELTTAASDFAIGIVLVGCIVALNRYRAANRRRVQIWIWTLGLIAAASVLGGFVHGLDLSPAARSWIWRPTYLFLGIAVALFVLGAVFDLRGERAARRALLPLLGLIVLFLVIAQLGSGMFLIFVAYEGLAMIAALAIYLLLALSGRLKGAGIIAVSIMLNLVAAAIQASGTIALTIVVPFDHNGVFHLVLMPALVLLTIGLSRGMAPATRTADSGVGRADR